MKKNILAILAGVSIIFATSGCKESSSDDTSASENATEHSDTTYMESHDNNGQPTTDSEGGSVTETKGAPESGYGNANNTELQPGTTGSAGSATQRGSDDNEKDNDKGDNDKEE
jgi:hypothetical protein